MIFKEAYALLKDGRRLIREAWNYEFYIKMLENKVYFFKHILSRYWYDDTIFDSTDWLIVDDAEKLQYSFIDVIEKLKQGHSAKIPEWESTYIKLDQQNKEIMIKKVQKSNFAFEHSDLFAEDWQVLND